MPLFHYQKTIHKRKLSPGPFKVYKTYKKYLRMEFNATCVYCRMPDSLSEMKSYAVEHYRPKCQFPDLITEYSNLFYSCSICNSYKGTYWPDEKDEKLEKYIPNPCDHIMHKHFRSQTEGTVKPYSFAGEWTIDLLDLNAPSQIKKRFAYLNIKKSVDSSIKNEREWHAKLKKIEKTSEGEKLVSVQADIAEIERNLHDLEEAVKIFGD